MADVQTLITVRPARAEDAVDLHRACWSDRPLDNVTALLERAVVLSRTGRGAGAVASYDGVLCGFGLLTLWPANAEVSDLCVGASYRSRGIGSELIAYLTGAARALQVATLEIGVALSNARARSLYERLGFQDDRLLAIDLGSGPVPILYLQKSLSVSSQRSSSNSPK